MNRNPFLDKNTKIVVGFVAAFIVAGLFLLVGTGRAANITPVGGSVQNGVAESYVTMSSTNPTWVRGKDGAVVQNGPFIFGNDATTTTLPSITNLSRYSIQLPYYNSTGTINTGSIVCATSGSFANGGSYGTWPVSSNTLTGTLGIVTATTSIWGVAADTCPASTVCNMIVSGFGLVLTTGTLNAGDLIVSSAPALGSSTGQVSPGYGGRYTGTVAVGSVIGTALSPGGAGMTAGGLTPALINKQ